MAFNYHRNVGSKHTALIRRGMWWPQNNPNPVFSLVVYYTCEHFPLKRESYTRDCFHIRAVEAVMRQVFMDPLFEIPGGWAHDSHVVLPTAFTTALYEREPLKLAWTTAQFQADVLDRLLMIPGLQVWHLAVRGQWNRMNASGYNTSHGSMKTHGA